MPRRPNSTTSRRVRLPRPSSARGASRCTGPAWPCPGTARSSSRRGTRVSLIPRRATRLRARAGVPDRLCPLSLLSPSGLDDHVRPGVEERENKGVAHPLDEVISSMNFVSSSPPPFPPPPPFDDSLTTRSTSFAPNGSSASRVASSMTRVRNGRKLRSMNLRLADDISHQASRVQGHDGSESIEGYARGENADQQKNSVGSRGPGGEQ